MPPFETPTRSDNMALVFQEILTVVMRLRAGRQRVGDPDVFRSQIRNAIKIAEGEGRRSYSVEDLRMGTFAVVAFLDETIENSGNPIFNEWRTKPLQEELFGVQTAGDTLFRNVERLLGRPDSEKLADILEVHQLCFLLGFHGRYRATGAKPEIREITGQIEERMRQIRGTPATLDWRPTYERPMRAARDRNNVPVLRWLAIGSVLLALVLFAIFKSLLTTRTGELNAIVLGVAL